MKRFALLQILFYYLSAFSQTISVSNFRLLESDLTANTAGTMETDQNGETAALIKVVTTQTGFTFDGGTLGIVKTKQTPGEVWVYIPKGSKKISIKHPQLGVLRDYYYPVAIEAARTYEMILASGTVQTIVNQDAGGQYLVMRVSPSSALVYIDDVETTLHDGIISKFMSYGKHDYRITDPLFKSDAGTFEIGQEKKEINIKLQPSYGQFEITSSPESGAEVYIDDETTPLGTTPFTTRPIKKGDHKFRIQKADYETKTFNHIVHDDGSTLPLNINLKPNYAIVKINIPDGCSLYINKELKGVGSWQGRLSEGLYQIEASKQGHTPSSQTINVKRGQEIDVNIQAPTPIYGSLNINCLPVGSRVYIDGQFMGESPCILNSILIGSHTLSIENDGYFKIDKRIEIEDNKIIAIDDHLTKNSFIDIPDREVKEICLNNWDLNKDGNITIEEAQKVQRLNGVFKYNIRIKNLDILKYFTGIEKIDNGEFYNCRNLESISLPESIKEIGDSAFKICRELKDFDYPKTISHIGIGAFADCDKLKGCMNFDGITYDYSDERSFSRSLFNKSSVYGYGICNFKIGEVRREDNNLMVQIVLIKEDSNSWSWTRINKKTYVEDTSNRKRYKLTKADGIAIYPETTGFSGELKFTLTFKGLPESVTDINLIEPDGWEIYGIKIL